MRSGAKRDRLQEDYFWRLHAQVTCDSTYKTTKAMPGIAFVTFVVGPAGQSVSRVFAWACAQVAQHGCTGVLQTSAPELMLNNKQCGSTGSDRCFKGNQARANNTTNVNKAERPPPWLAAQ